MTVNGFVDSRNTKAPVTLDRLAGAVAVSPCERIDRKTLPFSESACQSTDEARNGQGREAGVAIAKRFSPVESGKKSRVDPPGDLTGGEIRATGSDLMLHKTIRPGRYESSLWGVTNPSVRTAEQRRPSSRGTLKGIVLSKEMK